MSARLTVQSPAFTPAPFGLVASVGTVDEPDPHWRMGIQYQPDYCGILSDIGTVCVTGSGFTKLATTDEVPIRGANAFTVYAWINCSLVPFDEEEALARVTTALINNEAAQVERAFWMGGTYEGDVRPRLAANADLFDEDVLIQTAATVVVTGGVDVVNAIGLLEGAMGECYSGIPIIHVPKRAIANLADGTQITAKGQQLRTMANSLVIAGNGYDGSGPAGQEASTYDVWFYATGAIDVRRSTIEYTSTWRESVNKAENGQVLIAERTYLIDWDCCHFAIPVDLTGCCVDGGTP